MCRKAWGFKSPLPHAEPPVRKGYDMNLKAMLGRTVERFATRTAIVSGERRMTYADLDRASNKIASALIEMGVERGDRVATLLANSPEFVNIYFGIVKAGAVAVPLDTRYQPPELASLFTNCRPKVLIGESAVLEPLLPELPRFESIERVIDLGGRLEQFLGYPRIMATASPRPVGIEPAPDDIGTISYTGGPTSRPHGVALSHRNLVAEAVVSGEGFRQTERDVAVLFALPMFHMFGLASILLTSINKGSTVVVVPGTGRSVATFLETIEKEKGTIYMGVPYIYALAVNVAEREGVNFDLSSLRLWGSGGAALDPEIATRFKKHFGADILDIWGLTEAVSHVTYHPLDGTGKNNSTGKALPGAELAIADDAGNHLPPGRVGEVLVKGPMMTGYYNDPEATARTIKNGWLHTGDLGSLDPDGYLHLSGMKKNMIILKGQNIYPVDIENVLRDHPKVAEAVVVGIPDRLRGEIVAAIIRLKQKVTATEQEIRQFCQGRLSDYKLPKMIFFTRNLLRKASGNIGKQRLEDYLPDVASLSPSPLQRKGGS